MDNLQVDILEDFASFAHRSCADLAAHSSKPAFGHFILSYKHDTDEREQLVRVLEGRDEVTPPEACALMGQPHNRSTRAVIGASLTALDWTRRKSRRPDGSLLTRWHREDTITPARVLRALGDLTRVDSRHLCAAVGVDYSLGMARRLGRVLHKLGWTRTRGHGRAENMRMWVKP